MDSDFIKVKRSVLFNPNLTTDQKILFSYISHNVDISEFRDKGIPYYYMSSDEAGALCQGLGWSTKTLQRRLNELEALNMIQFERTSRGRKIFKMNFSLALRKSSRCWDSSVLTLGHSCPNSWDTVVPPIEESIKESNGRDIDNTDDDFFESKITGIIAE